MDDTYLKKKKKKKKKKKYYLIYMFTRKRKHLLSWDRHALQLRHPKEIYIAKHFSDK